uniref:Uncharacterized protein n=1 Tax=Globodera rostochiensis TaxID=31243 RepID=A0A914HAM6_GLORO
MPWQRRHSAKHPNQQRCSSCPVQPFGKVGSNIVDKIVRRRAEKTKRQQRRVEMFMTRCTEGQSAKSKKRWCWSHRCQAAHPPAIDCHVQCIEHLHIQLPDQLHSSFQNPSTLFQHSRPSPTNCSTASSNASVCDGERPTHSPPSPESCLRHDLEGPRGMSHFALSSSAYMSFEQCLGPVTIVFGLESIAINQIVFGVPF